MWFWNRRREDRELEEELRFHLEQEKQLRRERGRNPDAALRDVAKASRHQIRALHRVGSRAGAFSIFDPITAWQAAPCRPSSPAS